MIFNAIYFLMISNAMAASYTPSKLFAALDIDHNGIITPDELEEAILDMESVITIEKNPYICKIPLTHSFVDFAEKEMNYNVKINKINKVIHTNTYKKTTNDEMLERSESSYQKGRNSAMNDMVDIANTIMIADAIGSLFSLAIDDKDPY